MQLHDASRQGFAAVCLAAEGKSTVRSKSSRPNLS